MKHCNTSKLYQTYLDHFVALSDQLYICHLDQSSLFRPCTIYWYEFNVKNANSKRTKGDVWSEHAFVRKEKHTLQTTQFADLCTFLCTAHSIYFEFLRPSKSRHLACKKRRTKQSLSNLICHDSFRASIYVYKHWYARANLMPTQGVRIHPQMTVGTRVGLIRCLLVPLPPAGSLTAP